MFNTVVDVLFYHTAHSPKHTYRLIRQRFSDGATGLWPIFRMQRYALFLYPPNISAKKFYLFFEAFRPGKNERFDCRKSNQIKFEITPYVSGGEDGELPQAPTAAAQLRQRYTAPRKSPDDCNVSPCDTPSAPNPNHNIES